MITEGKAIIAKLGDGDFDVVITQATTIADWARVTPDFFPENIDMGDTTAQADIWMDFDGFESSSDIDQYCQNRQRVGHNWRFETVGRHL